VLSFQCSNLTKLKNFDSDLKTRPHLYKKSGAWWSYVRGWCYGSCHTPLLNAATHLRWRMIWNANGSCRKSKSMMIWRCKLLCKEIKSHQYKKLQDTILQLAAISVESQASRIPSQSIPVGMTARLGWIMTSNGLDFMSLFKEPDTMPVACTKYLILALQNATMSRSAQTNASWQEATSDKQKWMILMFTMVSRNVQPANVAKVVTMKLNKH